MGPLLVALAAILWATDALVRYPLIRAGIDPIFVVLFDHLFSVILLSPFVFVKYRHEIVRISKSQWLGLALIGGGASAVATVLFTTSFRYVNPSVTILLQKLQPIFVVGLAALFLAERPSRAFLLWGPVALIAGLLISFPDFSFGFLAQASLTSTGSLYALGAAGLWALATVIGKSVLRKLPPIVVTYWRFVFGLVTLVLMIAIAGGLRGGAERTAAFFGQLGNPAIRGPLLFIACVPGLLALILYYQGMVRTTASKTTFMELLFPVTAVTLNTLVLKTPLTTLQIAAGLVLLFAISRISVERRK